MKLDELVVSNPEVMSGTPVFKGTRVPVSTIFHYLAAGDPLDEFLDDFPSVTREHAIAVLELTQSILLEKVPVQVPPLR
jgi:uncharacterized protein (DUF433 family)